MSIARGAVAATLQASTPEARELLSRNIETLRAALEAKGLSVERLSITLAPASQGGSSGHSFNANNGSPNAQHHAAQQNASNQSSDHDASGERSRGFFEHHERHRHDRHPTRDHATDERLFQHRFGLHAIG
jgi:flagellar hook-length control protein FliK